jgi:hypothetical protein
MSMLDMFTGKRSRDENGTVKNCVDQFSLGPICTDYRLQNLQSVGFDAAANSILP